MLALDLLIFAIAPAPPTVAPPLPPPPNILEAGPPASPPPPPPGSYNPNETRPQPIDTARWFDGMLYPSAALRDGREGIVSYQLIIDPAGRPTDCRIMTSSGYADLDSATCDLLVKGARFRPALYDGKPVGSSYRGRMRWALTEEQKSALPDDAAVAAPPESVQFPKEM